MTVSKDQLKEALSALQTACPDNPITEFTKQLANQLDKQPENLTEINDPDNVLVSVTWSYADLLAQLAANGYEDDADNFETLMQHLDTRYMRDELIKLGNEHITSAIDKAAPMLKTIAFE